MRATAGQQPDGRHVPAQAMPPVRQAQKRAARLVLLPMQGFRSSEVSQRSVAVRRYIHQPCALVLRCVQGDPAPAPFRSRASRRSYTPQDSVWLVQAIRRGTVLAEEGAQHCSGCNQARSLAPIENRSLRLRRLRGVCGRVRPSRLQPTTGCSACLPVVQQKARNGQVAERGAVPIRKAKAPWQKNLPGERDNA